MPECNYPGCQHGDPNLFNKTSLNEGRCILHASSANKGIPLDRFNDIIYTFVLNNRLNLEGVIFPGDISFGKHPIRTRLNLKDAIFQGHVDFSNQNFTHETVFENCKFKAGVNFSDTKFNSTANFNQCEFSGSVSDERFGDCCALFIGATFENKADFHRAKFLGGNTLFQQAKFSGGYANFTKATFKQGIALFKNAFFNCREVGFKDVIFNCEIADFSSCIFENQFTDFTNAAFNHCEAKFIKVSLRGLNTSFNSSIFDCNSIDFSEANSTGQLLDLFHAKFRANTVNFTKAILDTNEISFSNITINANNLLFLECSFSGKMLTFFQARLFVDNTSFEKSKFNSTELNFERMLLSGRKINFRESDFNGKQVIFKETDFGKSEVNFDSCNFNCETTFQSSNIQNSLNFKNIKIRDGVFFFFLNPTFQTDEHSFPRIIFKNVKFNPFTTFFENIGFSHWSSDIKMVNKPAMIFRQSYLKDVYFTKCDLSLFSFYQCAFFEEAMFISNNWHNAIKPKRRIHFWKDRIKIWEENILDELNNTNELISGENAKIGNEAMPTSSGEIAELYMRFKASADKAKDYHNASQHYYNEFEMKRKFLIEKIRLNNNLLFKAYKLVTCGRLWLYNMYKSFAGYGEKPGLSFIWLLSAIFGYSAWYMFQGIETPNWTATYEFQWNLPLNLEFLNHFLHAAIYTIARIIPKSYRIFETSEISIINDNPFIAISNWLVITILIIFIGVGLKRHFRRF